MEEKLLRRFLRQLYGELRAIDEVIASLEELKRLSSGAKRPRGRPRKVSTPRFIKR